MNSDSSEIQTKLWMPNWVKRFMPIKKTSSEEELLFLLKRAADRNIVQDDTLKIIHGAIHITKLQVRDIMVPRARMVCVKVTDSKSELLAQIAESQHTRFPIIGNDIDDVRGILHSKDLIIDLVENGKNTFDISRLHRTASFIPESKRLDSLLKDFRADRRHMAIVVDEFAHTTGLITIEDVLEQIVGDIEDEHDQEEEGQDIVQIATKKYRLKGETPIEDFNTFFRVKLPTDQFDTIGGLVTRRFERVPNQGDTIRIDSFTFEIVGADERSIKLLHVSTS
ncbi:MAG: CBS domain-containing protein [Gammaproteobacteria bacterium]|nr:CBS domain-containing protein [Gammaproteobacteria bacterium]MYF52590.1 CBS domain-containing protein [Gammaproteobacteria bacterium]MYK43551.1 CBS domain-containing protein [Gammaproteobacteria bacterium]